MMTTVTVSPTNVRDRVSHSGAAIVLAGDPDTMWGDGSDATYAYRATSEPINGIMLADVAPFTLGTINTVTATMRVLLDPGNSDQRVDFWLDALGSETPAGTGFAFSGVGTWSLDPTATPGTGTTIGGVDLVSNATGDPMTPEDLTARFASGFTVGVARRVASGTGALTVYELTFTIDYTGPSAPAPLRIYPRSRTRIYPRRRTRRPGTF